MLPARHIFILASLLAVAPVGAASAPSLHSGSGAPTSALGNPEVSFSAATSTTIEAATVVSVQVVLSAAAAADVTIPYTVSGSADAADATVPTGPLVIPAGQISGSIDIQVNDDALSEGREHLILDLGTPTGGTLGTLTSHELTIEDDEPAATIVFDLATSMAAESAGTVMITLTLSAPRTEASSVTFARSGSASVGDVTLSPASPLVVPAGATTATLDAQIVSDPIDENDEDLIVTLLVGDNCDLGVQAQHTLTILDDDNPPLIAFATPNSTVVENDLTIGIGIELSVASSFDVNVPVSTSGTATDGVDYTWTPQVVTILAGSTSAALDVMPIDDVNVEPAETATFTLGSPTGATLGAGTTHDLLIVDDDGAPRVVEFQAVASSVDESAGVVSLVIELDQYAPQTVIVPVSAAGTAVAGSDYDLLTTMVTIPVGALTGTVDVNIIDDLIWEAVEGVDLTLGAPTGASLGAAVVHALTILDDDPVAASFAVAAQSVGEGVGTVLVDITLSGPATADVSVPLLLSGTAAARGVDVGVTPQPLVIPAGQSGGQFVVVVVGDALYEGDETLVMTLGALNGATPGAVTEYVLTIVDDDPLPIIEFTAFRTVVNESDGGFDVRFQLDVPSGLDVSVPFTVTGSASGPGDVTLPPSPAVVPAGELFVDLSATLVVDRFPELAERILFTLGAPTDAALGTVTSYLVLINDGDAGPMVVPPPLTPSVLALTFPVTRVGQASTSLSLYFTNLHSTPVVIESVSALGALAGEFTLSYPVAFPITLAPAEFAQVDVTFTPLARGPRSLVLRAHQQGQGVPPIDVAVSGSAFGLPGEEVVMNSAAEVYVGAGSKEWSAEYGATGGSLGETSTPVAGTADEALYQSYRFGGAFDYAIELPNGAYEVIVHTWEPLATAPGARIFDVLLEGAVVLDDLDIFVEVGARTAYVSSPLRVDVMDGILDVSIQASMANALVSAFEVRSIPVLSSPTLALDFGIVDLGNSVTLDMEILNSGFFTGTIDQVTFQLATLGSSEDFKVVDGGMEYPGAATAITFNTAIFVGPGTTLIPVVFTPTAHLDHIFGIVFASTATGDSFTVPVTGGGAVPGWGFLHPVIDRSPTLIIDYDGSGSQEVEFSAEASHTHEPGHAIAGWDWRVSGLSISTAPITSHLFAVGTTPMSLTIADDNAPPNTATDGLDIVVHPVDQVPGQLAMYYDGSSVGEMFLLDNVPATFDFAERLSGLSVDVDSGAVGGSPFTGQVMVRWVASFELASLRTLEFIATGGVDRRVLVDGALATGPLALASGRHDLDLRFAVSQLTDLPISLQILEGGMQAADVEGALVHDEQSVLPVIHTMPTIGLDLGGNVIEIEGFGFFPESQITVHWGAVDFTSVDFTEWGGERLVLIAPPGSGAIQVTIETPSGTSNSVQYVYSSTGPVPVRFDLLTAQEIFLMDPTCAKWGPDGNLYVCDLNGGLHVISYNDDYSLASAVVSHAGVGGLTNQDTLAIAFNPYDVYDPLDPTTLKVYIAHGQQWQHGGGSFTGTSDFTGQVSLLTGPNFDAPVPIVTGLPVSNHDHSVNGMEFDDNGDMLLCVGGNTNAGVKWPLLGDLPESPLSASIVKILLSKPSFNGVVEYVDSATGIPVADQVLGEQIEVIDGVDVEVVANGFRNAYDLCLHTNGYVYATDNGPNTPYGPESTGATTNTGTHPWSPDSLDLIEEGNYYGSASRSRGRYDDRQNVFYTTTAPSLPNMYTAPLTELNSSTNGLDEYRATTFNSAMRGELIAMKYTTGLYRIELDADGRGVDGTTLYSSPSNPTSPKNGGLDVVTGPGGAIIAIDYLLNGIRTQVPDDVGAIGVTPYDITPWRMPAGGGNPFVIGGLNFGTNQSAVSVRIGGMSAIVTSVSDGRIRGIVPPSVTGDETGLLDVEVQIGLTVRVIPAAFRYMPPTPGLMRGRWRTGTDLPQGLGDVVSAVVDGELFLFGDGDTRTFTYDLLQDSWSSSDAQRLYPDGGGHAAEVLDGKVFLFGGFDAAAAGRVQIYDPVLDQWALGAPMPWNGGGCVTATINGLVYVGGGVAPGGGTVANFASYDPVLDSWTALGALPTAVHMAASGTDGQLLYVFGGRTGMLAAQAGLDEVQIYDPIGDTWQTSTGGQASSMPLARSSTGRAIFWDGEFYVMGGADGVTTFAEVQAYDPVTGTWRMERDMPTARQAISPSIFQSRIFLHGGADVVGFGALQVTEVFSPR